MAQDLRSQIYKNFNQEETETLLEIWKTNNRSEWSDLAFEVLEKILLERLHELPSQNDDVLELEDIEEQNLFEKASDWFSKNSEKYEYDFDLEEDDGPVFYDPQEVLNIYQWLNKLAKAVIPISIILGFLTLPQFANNVRAYFVNSYQDMTIIIWIIAFLMMAGGVALQIVATSYPLKALAYVLKILMKFEHNSRK